MSESIYRSLLDNYTDHPAVFAYLQRGLESGLVDSLEDFTERVDESAFSMRSWLEALVVLDDWLRARSLTLADDDRIGYVSCAVEASGAGALMTSLPELTADLLAEYGCDRAKN